MIGYFSTAGYDGNGGDGLGYGCRQCVSYVAWKLRAEKGITAYAWGNATMWPSSAQSAGFSIGSTPRAGSMGVISARGNDPYGHIVWIESVEGNTVTVSQYNYWNAGGSGWGHYSKMENMPASTYDTYIYF
jgi:surface antigen